MNWLSHYRYWIYRKLVLMPTRCMFSIIKRFFFYFLVFRKFILVRSFPFCTWIVFAADAVVLVADKIWTLFFHWCSVALYPAHSSRCDVRSIHASCHPWLWYSFRTMSQVFSWQLVFTQVLSLFRFACWKPERERRFCQLRPISPLISFAKRMHGNRARNTTTIEMVCSKLYCRLLER